MASERKEEGNLGGENNYKSHMVVGKQMGRLIQITLGDAGMSLEWN
jgi:hypothetical protein